MNRLKKEIRSHPPTFWKDAMLSVITDAREAIAGDNGKMAAYRDHVNRAPELSPSEVVIDDNGIRIGHESDLSPAGKEQLHQILEGLSPWRKGPFHVFGTHLDCEWRSDWKWRRVAPHMAPLAGRRILDIGSSNGYYMFRMDPEAPLQVIGLEPFGVYYQQYRLLQSLIRADAVHCLPVPLESLPEMTEYFDTVFCMGVLHHARAPLDMLRKMRRLIRPGGEVVVENLIVEGEAPTALCPHPRYAKMHNVYFIPTVACLSGWMERAGFGNVRCVDITRTLPGEQRRTPWMTFESLEDFLDPQDPSITVEGYPAPIRAVLIAEAH